MKRIILFLATNLAVGLVLSVVLSLLGVNQYLAGTGLNVPALAVFSVAFGFVGSFVSLLISKPVAKFSEREGSRNAVPTLPRTVVLPTRAYCAARRKVPKLPNCWFPSMRAPAVAVIFDVVETSSPNAE